MSFLAWLDYSEHERRKMLDVIHLFKEQDTRDELGIGSVRDAFADLFFPGTTTIQTRARYFLFVPWMYQKLERQRVSSSEIASRAWREEVALIKALSRADDRAGTIGIDAQEKLKRMPSSVYWYGLGILGIRLFPGSQAQYHRSLDRYYLALGRGQKNDDEEWLEGSIPRNWHAGLPKPPADFPQHASHRLTTEEANYLRERILTSRACQHSLLAYLVDAGWEPANVDFAWQHPRFSDLPLNLQDQLTHARNFSDVIHGAALLYNLMLAEKSGRDLLIDHYRAMLQGWAAELDERQAALSSWDRQRFWEIARSCNVRITALTSAFINAWFEIAIDQHAAATIADRPQARRLIHERERQLKRALARLDNQRQLEQWSGESGTRRLDYRWPVARTIIEDILTGLAEGGRHA